jgi:hypothetical protein
LVSRAPTASGVLIAPSISHRGAKYVTRCFRQIAVRWIQAKAVGPAPTVTVLTVIVVKTTLRSDLRRDTFSFCMTV